MLSAFSAGRSSSSAWWLIGGLTFASACSSEPQTPGNSGGASNTGAGGATATGGVTSSGGANSAGGATGTTGGAAGSAGAPSAGGAAGASGGSSTGGASAGGASGSGGTSGSSGAGGSGGTSSTACERPVGTCSAPTVKVTEIDLGVTVTGYGSEWDTDPLPMAIAALPSGGSRIAVRGTNGQIYIGELDCNDQLVGTPFSVPGVDLQDLHADEDGGVVMLTRSATGSGSHQCGTGPLCGGTSAPCYDSLLVRFDNAGNEVWATPVTNLNSSLSGYQNGARFVWGHYQHHGRIAFDGENYAAYFCIGITVQNGSCVDIHEGDRMQVVSGSGSPITNHPDSFQVGCSHSWTTRMVWDPRTKHFVTVCATDNNCRIAQPSPYETVATGTCDGTLFNGDLVLSSTPGYWAAWSQGGQIRLEHFTNGASDQTISNAGASQHPHLVSYGPSHMLLTWESGGSMAAQVRDSGTGATVGSQFTINVKDHNYLAFKAFPDGSAAYPASGSNSTSARIARVMPCN